MENREIKFRAWNVRSKKMIDVNKIIWDVEGGVYVLDDNPYSETILMQFTGLKDKNGKEIYEGDVMECIDLPDIFKGTIVIEQPKLYQDGQTVYYGYQFYGSYGAIFKSNEWEIIGNIYEHPELIKQPNEA